MGTDGRGQPEPARIAGYRVLRRLGAGAHSEVYLGHAGDPDGGTVVIKVVRGDTDDDRLADVVTALTRAPAGTLPALVDLATLPDGRTVLVLERFAGPTLPELLDRRGEISAGEAVTILAPLAVTLAGLHAAGFAHTSLSLATVRFQPDGRPRVAELGGLRRLPPVGTARFDLLRADYRRLAVLAGSVVDRLPRADAATRRAAALVAWLEMAATAVPFQPALEEFERRLFAWHAAAPVRLAAPPRSAAVPGRLDPGLAEARVREGEPVRPTRLRRLATLLPPATALDHDPVRALGRRVRQAAAARRGPVTVLVCAGTAATVLALTVLPQPSTGAPGATPPPAATGTATATPSPSPSPVGPSGAIAGDEPVAAARALLAGRQGCLAAASVSCLDAFEQPGSAVRAADTQAIDAGRAGASVGAVGDLVQRIGDLAIVALRGEAAHSEPASLLLVRGEAGWRLREILG